MSKLSKLLKQNNKQLVWKNGDADVYEKIQKFNL